MHSVDPTTEMMIRSVLAYAENRLRLDPVPLDGCHPDAEAMTAVLDGLIGEEPHNPDQVLGAYTSVLAPAVISADSPRFLGFIPAAPTKAALLFDMLVSCAPPARPMSAAVRMSATVDVLPAGPGQRPARNNTPLTILGGSLTWTFTIASISDAPTVRPVLSYDTNEVILTLGQALFPPIGFRHPEPQPPMQGSRGFCFLQLQRPHPGVVAPQEAISAPAPCTASELGRSGKAFRTRNAGVGI